MAAGVALGPRDQTINQIRTLIVAAPETVRERLRGLATSDLIATLARPRPTGNLADPAHAIRVALRRLTRRYQDLNTEITEADTDIRALVAQAAPDLLDLPGVGPETAGQLLTRTGDTTPSDSEARPRSPTSAGPRRSRLPPGAPTATGRAAAATAPRTTPCTRSCWSA